MAPLNGYTVCQEPIQARHPRRGESATNGLLQIAAWLAGASEEAAFDLASEMRAFSGSATRCSTLNNDGTSLQICLTLMGEAVPNKVRIITDPVPTNDDLETRVRQSERVLSSVIASHAPEMKSLCAKLLAHGLPQRHHSRASLPGGGFWIAADLRGRGMALYTTSKWGTQQDRWDRARHWLGGIMPINSKVDDTLRRLSTDATLVCLGIEGATLQNARAKLYWRLEQSGTLSKLQLPSQTTLPLGAFLSAVIQDRRMPRSAIVGSIGFQLATGEISDVKLDVCGHCVFRTAAAWADILALSVARYNLRRPRIDCSVMLRHADLAFIGLGVDRLGVPRLNVYLKQTAQSIALM